MSLKRSSHDNRNPVQTGYGNEFRVFACNRDWFRVTILYGMKVRFVGKERQEAWSRAIPNKGVRND